MDMQTLVTLVVGAIVTALGFLFRYWKPLDPLKSWLEMALSLVGSLVIALVLGKLNPFPGGGDPVSAIQYFLESAAIVFAITQVVYNLVKQAFPDAATVKRAFKLATILTILGLSLALFAPSFALADSPQPYQYAMVQCSGLGTVENVVYANQQFDTWYGWQHQLTTPGMWQASYIARVNEFASAAGCPQVLQDDGTPTGTLTFWYKIYVPWYQRFAQSFHGAQP